MFICANRKKTSGYEYQGPWRDGNREGPHGKCFYYSESFYIGDWLTDMRHGVGEQFYKYNEERYIGEWKYDMRHGKCILTSVGVLGGQNGGATNVSQNCLNHYEGQFK